MWIVAREGVLGRSKDIVRPGQHRKYYGQHDQQLAPDDQQHAGRDDVWVTPESVSVNQDSRQQDRQRIGARDAEQAHKPHVKRYKDETNPPILGYEAKQRQEQPYVVPNPAAADSHVLSLATSVALTINKVISSSGSLSDHLCSASRIWLWISSRGAPHCSSTACRRRCSSNSSPASDVAS